MQIVHGAPAAMVPVDGGMGGVLPSTNFAPGGGGTSILITRRKLPSVSKTWMRAFPRSATYTLFCRSIPILCGVLNCPGSAPRDPQDLTQSPFLSILATREFWYPSLM